MRVPAGTPRRQYLAGITAELAAKPKATKVGQHGKATAKAIIVDGYAVLLTSANMTSAAYDKNIELGVLCRGGGVASQVQRHFDALISSGILARAA